MAARICPECGVPRRITREHRWLDNGTIVERKNPDHRMIFFERDNMVDLFTNIEKIIGMDIERIIIESQRRSTYDYVVELVPAWLMRALRRIALKPLSRNLLSLSSLMGYGNVTLDSILSKGSEEDHITVTIRDPWFLSSYSGLLVGGMEAVTGLESSVKYEEVSPGVYRITAYFSSLPKELLERLQPPSYSSKPGDLELERCPRCKGPLGLSRYRWDLEMGIITDRESGQRMALFGPMEFDAIFIELENELGEHIPEVVVEAQRRFVKESFYSRVDALREIDFGRHLALRGLGNLREFEQGGERTHVRVENPCLQLVLVGLFQGIYELVFDREGKVEWELAGGGDLDIEITA